MVSLKSKLLYLFGAFISLHQCSSSPVFPIKSHGRPNYSSNNAFVYPTNVPYNSGAKIVPFTASGISRKPAFVAPRTIHVTTQAGITSRTANVVSNITRRVAGVTNNAIAPGMVSSGINVSLLPSTHNNGSVFHNFSINALPAVSSRPNIPKTSSRSVIG